ncbi:DNA topoisomerase 2 [Hypoxylon texense]
MDGKLVVSRKKKQVIVEELRERKYESFPRGQDSKKTKSEEDEEGNDEGNDETEVDTAANGYDYLLSMPIWSFTQERLDRLKDQIVKKKEERDALAALSEKDLWCKDLDDFEAEWENQLRLDAEITTGIRRLGRRASKKIGAGRGRKAKGADDDYAPVAKSRPGPKAAAKPKEPPKEKSVQRFAAMFNGGTKKKTGLDGAADSDDDPFSDDDFSKLKNPVKKEQSVAQDSDEDVQPAPRTKRAAATKAKTWIVDDDESESDDDKMLGDVGDLVKGISNGNASASESKTGRLSLFSMSRPESSSGNSASLKVKSKPSKVVDLDDHDDTNYEMLAKSSPHKNARADELDSFLSDDDLPTFSKTVSKPKSSAPPPEEPEPKAAAVKEPAVKSRRGRPAVAKTKAKEDKPAPKKAAAPKAAPKAVKLSPAAKAYAAKKEKAKPKRDVFDMDDDEDDDMELDEPDSPPPRPVARGRPGRAAAAKSKPVYIIDDDDEEEEDELELPNDDDEQSDDFAMDDSE